MCDEHNGYVLYTGSSVMDTIDMCHTRHLLSLVILSLQSVQSCYCLPRFYKYSVTTVYVSSLAVFHCFILFLPFTIFKRVFSSNHYTWNWLFCFPLRCLRMLARSRGRTSVSLASRVKEQVRLEEGPPLMMLLTLHYCQSTLPLIHTHARR